MDADKIANLLSQINDLAAGVYELAASYDPENGFDAEAVFHGSTEEELEQTIEYLSTAYEALSLAENGGSR